MALSSGIKFRCYPTEDQKPVFSQCIGYQRFIYNAKVAGERYFRTFRNHQQGLTGSHVPVDQQYSQFKDREQSMSMRDRVIHVIGYVKKTEKRKEGDFSVAIFPNSSLYKAGQTIICTA